MKRSIALIASLLVWASAASAQDKAAPENGKCALIRLASLDMTQTPKGPITVPVGIAGKARDFAFGLQGATAITTDLATELKPEMRSINYSPSRGNQPVFVMGAPAYVEADVLDVQIGSVHMATMPMYVAGATIANHVMNLPVTNGVLGTSLLKNFDVEVDFKANKLNLYSPTACGGGEVYWAHAYAAVPFQLDMLGSVFLQMQLDGKSVSVGPNLDGSRAGMGTTALTRIFGVPPDSPLLKPTAEGDKKVFLYPFKTLAVDGLTINNPAIVIHTDNPDKQCDGKRHGFHICVGGTDLIIGQNELRGLHLFFSFKEKMLYLTDAEAHL